MIEISIRKKTFSREMLLFFAQMFCLKCWQVVFTFQFTSLVWFSFSKNKQKYKNSIMNQEAIDDDGSKKYPHTHTMYRSVVCKFRVWWSSSFLNGIFVFVNHQHIVNDYYCCFEGSNRFCLFSCFSAFFWWFVVLYKWIQHENGPLKLLKRKKKILSTHKQLYEHQWI